MKFVQLMKIDREKLKYIVKQYKLIEKCDKMLSDCGVYSRTGFHRDLVTANATQIKKKPKKKNFYWRSGERLRKNLFNQS